MSGRGDGAAAAADGGDVDVGTDARDALPSADANHSDGPFCMCLRMRVCVWRCWRCELFVALRRT